MSEKMIPNDFTAAVKDIKLAILQARARAARVSNVEALKLYFYVGGYISKKTRNAKWGSGAIDALSERLQVELPGLRGFSAQHIRFMRQFYEEWYQVVGIINKATPAIRYLPSSENKEELRYLMSRKSGAITFEQVIAFLSVGFTHHRAIFVKCKSLDERWYYILSCAKEHWSVIELERHIAQGDYRHIGTLPNNFEKTLPIVQATRAVRSFRDEYLLELMNLDNVDAIRDQDVDERVLSKELVANIEKTIAALGGSDFCFMGREKRLIIEGEELFIDLLFYHRSLQAMVAIELKMGKFRASYLGQLSQYLSVLDATERKANENPSIGLLLCEKMNKPVVELAVQGYSQPIGIATYRALRNIPEPYKTLAPVIDGVRRVLVEHGKEKRKSLRRKAK
ncbi:MAG: DUF1016 family protein [Kiritimatiellae bacterium]|nr:DUF1016 family protein [Kiritimatiellia bacterium]